MVCGPEVARCISEFEASLPYNQDNKLSNQTKHHEQTKSSQQRFYKHVVSLVASFEKAGNPFLEDSEDLISLDSRYILSSETVKTLQKVEEIGEKQFNNFVNGRLKSKKESLFDPIKRNKIFLFNQPSQRISTAQKDQITTLKRSCQLFSQLYIACQVRDGDIDEFFRHENNSYPPSISKNGNLRSGKKSDLINCLIREDAADQSTVLVDCIILDGAAIANMIKPNNAKTFKEYADRNFVPHIKSHLNVNARE